MKLKSNIKSVIIELICLLYVLLFVYAAVSKLLDFENFQIQLGQSPLLSPFTSWILFAIPALEILIALLFLIPRYRLIGLFASYTLMAQFTAYIIIILNYSSFVPCSCGGVIQKLSWNQHIIFNCFFIALAGIAILLFPNNNTLDNPKTAKP